MTDEQELNKKLAEWAGLEDALGLDRVPNFTHSLDACFKWLVPRASEDGYEVAISTEGKDCYGELFGQGQGDHLQADVETPALALCLAIEKLIESEISK